jgi:hypothetical protein
MGRRLVDARLHRSLIVVKQSRKDSRPTAIPQKTREQLLLAGFFLALGRLFSGLGLSAPATGWLPDPDDSTVLRNAFAAKQLTQSWAFP